MESRADEKEEGEGGDKNWKWETSVWLFVSWLQVIFKQKVRQNKAALMGFNGKGKCQAVQSPK